FTVSATPADTGGSGVAAVDFPALAAAGFSGPAKSAAAPGPYGSDSYSFTSANASAPSFTATVSDGAGNSHDDSPTLVRDVDPPTAPTITAPSAGPIRNGQTVSASTPTDAGAGGPEAEFPYRPGASAPFPRPNA